MSHENHASLSRKSNPLLVVLSGLSGAGKDAVLTGLKESGFPIVFVTTVTTRARRANEKDGRDYHFVSDAGFRKMIDSDKLIEWAEVYGNYYGVPDEPVQDALKKGKDVIVKVDVQGAETIKRKFPQALFIFLTTPSVADVAQRLRRRQTEKPEELDVRLRTALQELEKEPMFDYTVVNREGELEKTVAEIASIIIREKSRETPRKIDI